MRSGTWLAVVLATGVALIGGWLWANGDGIDEQPGAQIRSPEVTIGEAESRLWSVLGEEDRSDRPDFPRPLVAKDAQLCFGFERLDFGSPARPSLARCVEREALQDLPENGIASIFVIETGLDTWHVFASASSVDEVAIVYPDNTELSSERIFVSDDVIALRLPNDLRVETMSWTLGRTRYHCEPPPDAVRSGTFCI